MWKKMTFAIDNLTFSWSPFFAFVIKDNFILRIYCFRNDQRSESDSRHFSHLHFNAWCIFNGFINIYTLGPTDANRVRDKRRFLHSESSVDSRFRRQYNRRTGSVHQEEEHDSFRWLCCLFAFPGVQNQDQYLHLAPHRRIHSSLDPKILFYF